jgi:hypothetical protein
MSAAELLRSFLVICCGRNLARDVLQLRQREVATMDFQSCGTTLLLVDDDIEQLELRASVLKMSGFPMCEGYRNQSCRFT